jgi:hypothetical protein
MKKWAISAVVYLLVVVGAYYAYASYTGNEVNHAGEVEKHNNEDSEVAGHEEGHGDKGDTSGHEEGHGEKSDTSGHAEGHGDSHDEHGGDHASEVLPMLHEESGNIILTLKDLNGNLVSELDVNHEKLMHLIVVGKDLQMYKHLHPESTTPGVFKVEHGLEDGEYKFFVDIKPKDLAYEVQSISFIIGSPDEGHHHGLQVDEQLVKQVDEHLVTLKPTSLTANEDIQLKFDLNGETPEHYLGALGHVVILDEKAEKYIHVHPHDGNEPIFETKFTEPGIYKIWAEFKFGGEVLVFPYVVEIK